MNRPGRVWLVVVSVPLGLVLSMALQAPSTTIGGGESSIRAVSAETILRLEEEQRELREAVRRLRRDVAMAQQQAAAVQDQLQGVSNEISELRVAAGLTPVRGAGLRVTLDDSQGRSVPAGTDPNLLIVHDYDLRDLITLLWSNGATALAVNGQRLVATTSIYCVGSTILVNDTRLSAPYVVEATGPAVMHAAITEPTAMARYKGLVRQYGLGLSAAPVPDITIPSFDGRMPAPQIATLVL